MSESITRNDAFATLSVVLALFGVILVDYGIFLAVPSLVAAGLGWRRIQRNPKNLTGKLFIYAAIILNVLLVGAYLLTYF